MSETRHKLGRFKIAHEVLQYDWRNLLPALSCIVVVRAESKYDLNCIEYVGLSDAFEPVEDGKQPPLYEFRYTENKDGTKTGKWEQVENT